MSKRTTNQSTKDTINKHHGSSLSIEQVEHWVGSDASESQIEALPTLNMNLIKPSHLMMYFPCGMIVTHSLSRPPAPISRALFFCSI